MTVVPENAALCACWRRAPKRIRDVEYLHRNRLVAAPRGLRECPFCHGAGYYNAYEIPRWLRIAEQWRRGLEFYPWQITVDPAEGESYTELVLSPAAERRGLPQFASGGFIPVTPQRYTTLDQLKAMARHIQERYGPGCTQPETPQGPETPGPYPPPADHSRAPTRVPGATGEPRLEPAPSPGEHKQRTTRRHRTAE